MDTIYWTKTCKRYARTGDTLVIRTEGGDVAIKLGTVTEVTVTRTAGHDVKVTTKPLASKPQAAQASKPQAAQASKPQAAQAGKPQAAQASKPQATAPAAIFRPAGAVAAAVAAATEAGVTAAQAARKPSACECGRVHKPGSAAAQRCADAGQAAANARTVIRAGVAEPAVTEPAEASTAQRFTATVTFANGTDDSRTGILPDVSAWLAAHNPAIVTGVIMVRADEPAAEPQAPAKVARPQAARKPAAKPQASKPQASKPQAAADRARVSATVSQASVRAKYADKLAALKAAAA